MLALQRSVGVLVSSLHGLLRVTQAEHHACIVLQYHMLGAQIEAGKDCSPSVACRAMHWER